MASPDGGAFRPRLSSPDVSDSESGSSYIGSDAPTPNPTGCPWRNAQFHDQECSRYFDCPSHIVERALSDHGDSGNTREGVSRGDDAGEEAEASPMSSEEHGEAEPGGALGSAAPSNQRAEEEEQAAGSTMNGDNEMTTPSPDRGNTGERDLGAGPETAADAAEPTRYNEAISAEPVESLTDGPPAPPAPETLPTRTSRLGEGFESLSEAESAVPELPDVGPSRRLSMSMMDRPLPASPGSAGPSSMAGSPTTRRTTMERREPPGIILPRWQPDAEVTYCPICHAQFSIFVRKHHCRYALLIFSVRRKTLCPG